MDLAANPETVLARVGLLPYFSVGAGSHLQGTVESTPRNPFTDSHAISTLTDIVSSVRDVDQVDMSTYQNEETGGWSWICSQFHQAC